MKKIIVITIALLNLTAWSAQDLARVVAHMPGSGKYLVNNPWRPVTKFLVDRYCSKNLVKRCTVLRGHTGPILVLAITPDGKYCVTGSFDHTARVWNLETGECEKVLKEHTGLITALVITPDGKYCITGSHDHTACVWNLATGVCEKVLGGHINLIRAITITHDGNHCIIASSGTARVWNLETGECEKMLEGNADLISDPAITPDGKYIVTKFLDYTARVCNLATGACEKVLKGHTGSILVLAITPNGKYCVTGSEDHTARIWNLTTGVCENVLEEHTDSIKSLAVTPDGKYCITGSDDCTARIWHFGAPAPLQEALEQLSIVQVTLLMDIVNQQQCKKGSIHQFNADGSKTDSYHAFANLPVIIKELIDQYVQIDDAQQDDQQNIQVRAAQPGVCERALTFVCQEPLVTSALAAAAMAALYGFAQFPR
jgi:WD40 repeat protein